MELLSSAYGLVCFGWGVTTILGPPIAGALVEQTNDPRVSLFLAGSLYVAGGGVMLVAWLYSYCKL